jgi:sarcosine oxidase subunit gamma
MENACMLERRSLLAPALAVGGRDGAQGGRALSLREVRGWWLTQVGAFPGREASFNTSIGHVLGVAFEPPTRRAAAYGDTLVLPIAPRQYWMLTLSTTLDRAWQSAISPTDGSATALSHGRCRLAVIGAAARDVLSQGFAVDLHPDAMPIGGLVQAGLHHTGALLYRAGIDRYELFVLSTFADTLWGWLTDAALSGGYDVGVETTPGH